MNRIVAFVLGMFALCAIRGTTEAWGQEAVVGQDGDAEPSSFAPIQEANMPDGFPPYTPVGTIEVKHYPPYRKASASGSATFWRLFSHIKRNQIAMTAPVELTFAERDARMESEESMAFLYGDQDAGATGKQGSVAVSDVPAMIVVSIGVRGVQRADAVREAREKLKAWLKDNAGTYVAAGPPRVMAYNSPFVPEDRRFYEVQIPISRLD
jgi:hypothetical protein